MPGNAGMGLPVSATISAMLWRRRIHERVSASGEVDRPGAVACPGPVAWGMLGCDDRLSLPLPRNLVVAAEQQGRTAWLTTLPATVARLTRAWSLSVEVPFQPGGQTAWVAPARDRAGAEMVLKVAWAHPEALHEGEGLQLWAGHGAVRLHALEKSADTTALLLERCRPGTPLAALPSRARTRSSPACCAGCGRRR